MIPRIPRPDLIILAAFAATAVVAFVSGALALAFGDLRDECPWCARAAEGGAR